MTRTKHGGIPIRNDYILKIVNAVMENFDRSKVKEKYGPLTSTSSSAQKHQGTYKIPADSQELPVGTLIMLKPFALWMNWILAQRL